ncbi:MAG: hypothetical protein WCP79_08665 [Bacillota bacterium]
MKVFLRTFFNVPIFVTFFIISLALFVSPSSSSVALAGMQISINNYSGYTVYIYDVDLSDTAPTAALSLSDGKMTSISLQTLKNPAAKVGRRIYVSNMRLGTIEKNGGGLLPDGFCPWNDGNAMYSFAEYNYEPVNNRYTIDLQYIDEFSFPLTIKFGNVGKYSGCQENFEYGLTSFSDIASALNKQSSYWSNLVWNTSNPACPITAANWPKGIYRIIGPNKVWTSQSSGGASGLSGYAPNSYQSFVNEYPFNGDQLFQSSTNFDGWRYTTNLPASTGYVKALHSVATPDKTGKYGFFTYCKDNYNGEFTWVPVSVTCELKIYHYDR